VACYHTALQDASFRYFSRSQKYSSSWRNSFHDNQYLYLNSYEHSIRNKNRYFCISIIRKTSLLSDYSHINMMEYQAKSTNAKSFQLMKSDELVAYLNYKNWFKFNAEIVFVNRSVYQIEPKGFWETKVELRDGENVLLNFQMNWKGEIIIQAFVEDLEQRCFFRHRGFFKESFELTNQERTKLLVMKPQLKWKKMNYEYQISTSDAFEALPSKEILLMSSLHCANCYMYMATAE